MSKKWWLSRSIWLGFLAIAGAIVQSIASGASWEAITLAAFGAAAVVLRSVTELPLGK